MIFWPLSRRQPPSPPIPPCPDCPSIDFVAGATTLRGAPIVTCMGCGARWYLSGGAWRKPHPRSLPAAWAQLDSLERMERQQAEIAKRASAESRGDGPPPPPLPRRRQPHEGFRRPPAMEETP